MKNPGISIIMPLYNAARFLEESLESIRKQSFQDFELICINDASTDNTIQILQTFQIKDSRIKILSNDERRGAAFSRNRGMREAKGTYLSFLDGDDIFEEEMLKTAYPIMENLHLDVVSYEYVHVDSKDIGQKQFVTRSPEYRERYCHHPFSIKEYLPEEILRFTSSPCNKLYRRQFIEENCLEFQTLSCANDVYFVNMALMLSERMMILDDSRVMVYARDHSEPMRISSKRDPMCTFLAMEKIQKELIVRNQFAQLYEHFYYRVYWNLKSALEKTKSGEEKEAFYCFLRQEGIERLRSSGGAYYRDTDWYIRRNLERFEKEDFNSGWYQKTDNLLELFLNKKKELLIELFDDCTRRNFRIGIWGAGDNGRELLKFCEQHGLRVDAVIDKSVQRQGKMLMKYEISAPEAVLNDIQLIIVSAYSIYDSVKAETGGRNIEVVDLQRLLEIIL